MSYVAIAIGFVNTLNIIYLIMTDKKLAKTQLRTIKIVDRHQSILLFLRKAILATRTGQHTQR